MEKDYRDIIAVDIEVIHLLCKHKEIAIQPKGKDFQAPTKRRIAVQTFAQIVWYQRLSLDYQNQSLHSEHTIYIAHDNVSNLFQAGSKDKQNYPYYLIY